MFTTKQEGWPLNNFKDHTLSKYFQCQICHQISNDPVQDDQKHTFCKNCINELFENSNQATIICPFDLNHKIEQNSLVPFKSLDPALSQIYNSLYLDCPNFFCNCECQISSVASHFQNECQYKNIEKCLICDQKLNKKYFCQHLQRQKKIHFTLAINQFKNRFNSNNDNFSYQILNFIANKFILIDDQLQENDQFEEYQNENLIQQNINNSQNNEINQYSEIKNKYQKQYFNQFECFECKNLYQKLYAKGRCNKCYMKNQMRNYYKRKKNQMNQKNSNSIQCENQMEDENADSNIKSE